MRYIFILCCFFTSIASGQINTADSLKQRLATLGEDTFKVNTLNELSRYYLGKDSSLTLDYARKALQLSEQLGYYSGGALALKNIGLVHYMHSQFLETLEFWNQSLTQYELAGDVNGMSNMLSNVGAVFKVRGSDDKALEYFLKALQKAEQTGNKLRIMTALMNTGSVYGNKYVTHNKALTYYLRALPIAEEINDVKAIGTTSVNMGEIYLEAGNADSAEYYLERSIKAFEKLSFPEQPAEKAYSLIYLGKVYTLRKQYARAIEVNRRALQFAEVKNSIPYISKAYQGIAENELLLGNYQASLAAFNKAYTYSSEIKDKYDLKSIYDGFSNVYAKMKDYPKALEYQTLLSSVKDSIYNIETDKKLGNLFFDYQNEKKQGEINLLTKDKELQTVQLKREKLVKNALIIGITFIFIISFIIYRDYRQKIKLNKLLDNQKMQIESLLLNILPEEVANELQEKGEATPRYYEKASVLFTDFKGFSSLADRLSPQEVVTELNECFIAFDNIIAKYKLEKIKTIGDSYMCAGGIPTPDDNHIYNIIKASLEIQEYIVSRNERRKADGLPPWDVRIGINTGPLVAGVVGKIKYAYDIWGGTVNVASRMESNGEPGRVNISSATYELIKHKYACTYRGKIFAKNIGEIDMYFIDHEINA